MKHKDAETWRKKRRPEVLALFATHVYGKTPAKSLGKPLPIAKGRRSKFNKPAERQDRVRLAVPSRRIELCGHNSGGAPDFDDLRVYSVPLTAREIEALYRE